MSLQTVSRLLLLLLLLFSGGTALAREVLRTTTCTVEAEDVIEGTLFVLCQELHINGVVNGDVIGAAVRIVIDGRVNGNLYLVAGQLDIRGHVVKDVHFGGPVLRVNPPRPDTLTPENGSTNPPNPLRLGGSLKALSLSTTVFENTIITDSILNTGYQLVLHGNVGDEVSFIGSAFVIDSVVDGNVYATVGNPEAESRTLETLLLPFNFDVELRNPGLLLTNKARVSGDLAYTGPVEGTIQGVVDGEVLYSTVSQVVLPTLEEPGSLTIYFSQMGREFTTLLAIGAIAIVVFPQLLPSPLRNLRTRPFSSFGVGMLAFLLSFPVVLIVLVLSVMILIILQLIGLDGLVVAGGIVLALVDLGGVSLFYFMAIFVARALVGLALGRFLMRVLYQHREGTLWLLAELALGLLVLSAVVSLPVIGLLFNAAVLFMGLGTILTVLLVQIRQWRDTAPPHAVDWYTPSPAVSRQPPTIPDIPRAKLMPATEAADSDDPVPPTPSLIPIPPPPPPPETDATDSGQAPGMSHLPEGFDFSFFEDGEQDE